MSENLRKYQTHLQMMVLSANGVSDKSSETHISSRLTTAEKLKPDYWQLDEDIAPAVLEENSLKNGHISVKKWANSVHQVFIAMR